MNLSRQVALFKQTMQTDGNSNFHFLLKLLMMIICFMLMFFVDISFSVAKGLAMLKIISSTNLFFVTIATVSLFSTSITEEKEHNTLGVLLMTGISPFGFLLGKTVSRLYIVIQLILLQVPLIVVARTMGGLSMDQILAHIVYFAVLIITMSQIGIIFSIICSRSSYAILFSCVALGFLSWLPCDSSSTFFGYYFKVFETGFNNAVFAQPVYLLLGFSLALFCMSLMIFNKFTHGEDSDGLSRDLTPTTSVNRPRYSKNPIFQKDFRYYAGNKTGMVVRAGLFCVIIYLSSIYRIKSFIFGVSITWFYAECFYYSQVMIKLEKSGKTLLSLGALPMNAKDILNQKYMAFLVSVLPSLLTFLITNVSLSHDSLPNLVTFSLFTLSILSHFLIALLCSIVYDRMSLVVSVLYILLYSLTFFLCPMGWLLFLPSLVILSVNVYERFASEFSSG